MPLAILTALGVAGCGCWLWILGERHRRRRLNGSLHELRRPAQLLALMAGRGQLDQPAVRGCLDQLALGLDDLDRAVNGGVGGQRELVSASSIARSAERRWGWSERVEVSIGEDAVAEVDAPRLGAAIDNLVANSLEHGRGRVRLQAGLDRGRLALSVEDEGAPLGPTFPTSNRASSTPRSGARETNPHRGHGEQIISRTIAEHGGRIERAPGGHVSSAFLPLAGGR